MPILIFNAPPPAGVGAALHLSAVTAEFRPARLRLTATTAPTVRSAALHLEAEVSPAVRGAALTVTALTAGDAPVQVITGDRPHLAVLTVSGLGVPQKDVLSAEHAWTEDGTEEFTVTVRGVRPSLPWGQTVTVQATGRRGDTLLGTLPLRSFTTQSQEPEVNEAAGTTTFRFRNDFMRALRGTRLPELIPWVREPSDDPCLTTRRTVDISGLVHRVMRDHVDVMFALLEGDPLAGETWVEGRREYVTEGKTPLQVWEDTYGRLGMVLSVQPRGAGVRLVGLWPDPVAVRAGVTVPEAELVARAPRDLRLHTPALLTVRGADFVTALTPQKLLEWVGNDPAYQEIAREVLREGEFIDPMTGSGTARTVRGWRKTIGQLTAEVMVTTDDVDAQETVDGVNKTRNFRGVGVGYTHTVITLDPDCPTRPLRKVTRTKGWAYALDTELGTFQTTGPGLYWNLTVGDLTADEETVTTYTYSPQGHELTRTESSTALASVQQQDAELPPGQRGKVAGREYVRTVKRTSWVPNGAGGWQCITLISRQKLVPLYDVDTNEAIRMQLVTSTLPMPTEVTDQAPASFDCVICETKEVHDETGVRLNAGDAGPGEEAEVTIEFLDPGSLTRVARLMLASRWHRRERTFTAPFPLGVARGDWVNGGRVKRMVTKMSNGVVDCEVLTSAPLTDFMIPGAAAVLPVLTDPARGRSIMLSGKPGGARVRRVKGWNPVTAQPIVEDAFVVLKTGFPPRPGAEIDWVRAYGRLEARNAR